MKIITLYSDVDDFIITCIVGLTALMFFVNWVYLKMKEQRKNTQLSLMDLHDENDISVNEYALNFNHDIKVDKSIRITSKIILVVFSIVIIVMPLHDLVVTLRPIGFFEGWTCFPF